MMIANASGKAAIRPMPPNTSQVSLPSQTGAIEFITMLRWPAVRHQPVEDADTEIEAVEHHVIKHRQRQEGGP